MSSTPVLNLIMANVATTIAGITKANGFNCDLTVNRLSQLPPSPSPGLAMIRREKPEQITEDVPQWFVQWRQPISIFVAFPPASDQLPPLDDQLGIYLADISDAMQVDYTRGGLAIDTTVAEPSEEIPPEGTFYVAAVVTVIYRTLLTDAYTAV